MRTDHTIESQSIESIEQFNNQLLREHVQYCYECSPYYHGLFETSGLKPEHIKAKEDLHLLPLTLKEHLEENAEDFLCVPEQDIVDMSNFRHYGQTADYVPNGLRFGTGGL